MKVPKVNRCCCGCTLYRGTMIIAVFAAVFTIISIIRILIRSAGTEVSLKMVVDTNSLSSSSTQENVADIDKKIALLQSMFAYIDGVMVVHAIVLLALSLLLIYGTIKRSPAHILPWLVTQVVLSVSALIAIVGASIFVIVHLSAVIGVVMLLVMLLGLALEYYFLVVVYSFYVEVKSPTQYEDTRQVNYKV